MTKQIPHEPGNSAESAPSSSIEEGFLEWEDDLRRLERDALSDTSEHAYPEWWYSRDNSKKQNLLHALKSPEATADSMVRYYDLLTEEERVRKAIAGNGDVWPQLTKAIDLIGENNMGRALSKEDADGKLHGLLLDYLRAGRDSPGHDGTLSGPMRVVANAYGLETVTELLGVQGDDYTDQLRAVVQSPNLIWHMRSADREKTEDWSATNRNWMKKAISVVSGMDEAEAAAYVLSASKKAYDEENIVGVIEKFEHFGADRIRSIATGTGIHGLEGYSIAQLKRMERFVDQPQELAEELAAHDVTVVLINRVGDHNGVLKSVASQFDDEAARTLFFEIDDLPDIYRRMIQVHKVGIKPATLVLAAHSDRGQFIVSKDNPEDESDNIRDIATVAARKLVNMVNNSGELQQGDFGYSLHGMRGLSRVVEDYMSPSRAVDDSQQDEHRKKIIFQACYAGSEVKVKDLNDQGELVENSVESVITQLGKDLLASGVRSNVDIYGAGGRIQMHRSESGLYYSGAPESIDGDRVPMVAERVRIEAGKLEREPVEEIVLRK